MLGNGIVHGMHNPAMVWYGDQSLYFDGVNDFARFETGGTNTASTALINLMRISLWVQMKTISNDQSILYIKDADGNAYLKLWYDLSAEQLVVTRTDGDGNNPVSLQHNYTVERAKQNRTNIQIKIEATGMSISTTAEDVSVTATSSSGSGSWAEEVNLEFYLGRDLATGSELFNGWISNLAIWNQADLWGAVNNADVFNSGYPKSELETVNAALFLYYIGSETTLGTSQQEVTQSLARANTINHHGPILVTHGQTS